MDNGDVDNEGMTSTGTLGLFTRATREWFTGVFDVPTPIQVAAWDAIRRGSDALVIAPTGSGKTLAAFLWAIDRLLDARGDGADISAATGTTDSLGRGTRAVPQPRGPRILYISPLKALGVDVERNLTVPLRGISERRRALGEDVPDIRVAVRSGDTPSSERARLVRKPPDILITTPESLYLMETSKARETLRQVQTVIVDEVHAVAGTKRGAHLAVSLERLDALLAHPAQRIGLSATVRPADEVARFLGGSRPVEVVAPPASTHMDVRIVVPVEDMRDLPARPVPHGNAPGEDDADSSRAGGTIWPHVEASILERILENRSTIVFVNSRGLAERLTARLNDLWSQRVAGEVAAPGRRTTDDTLDDPATPDPADTFDLLHRDSRMGSTEGGLTGGASLEIARAHHGSVSKERRALIEHDLKSGELRCVVATSSLELGIDMGLVDLVIQVSAPPSVASGLQRIGRAGHHVGGVSRGLVYPRTRRELIDAAVTVEGMTAGHIEAISIPRNPLDILAQQTVAASVGADLSVDDWFTSVRRSAPFHSLSRRSYEGVLDMLSGRYPAEEFSELRPRLIWDREAGVLRARPGAQRLAVTSGGTIPDRGSYRVVLPEVEGERGAKRVGELDEEMVFESRVNDVVTLGATSWRIQEITTDRVVVVPAPGRPARLPFWHGDGMGRPAELGAAMGTFIREITESLEVSKAGASDGSAVEERLSRDGLDAAAGRNLLALLSEQRSATGVLPTDMTLVVERCRDEAGDWRLILHSPWGWRVHAPWALAIGERIRVERGVDAQVMAADDGIVVRLPETAGRPPGAEIFCFEGTEIARLVRDSLGSSALFAGRFRECAARALLLPRRDPGHRTPLWQQRQRASQLLAVASSHPEFPILLEAARECLQDVYDLSALTALLERIGSGDVHLVETETRVPSPFAAILLFGYLAAHVYDQDAPAAERRTSVLSLDTSLLADLLGEVDLGEVLDPKVVARLGRQLQRTEPGRRARGIEGLADILRTIGPLSTDEVAQRCEEPGATSGWLAELAAQGRIRPVAMAGSKRWSAVEDLALLRDGLGVSVPEDVPAVFLEEADRPLHALALRFARSHGPFSGLELARRLGIGAAVAADALDSLRGEGLVVSVSVDAHQWVGVEVLRTLRMRSLAAARAATRPVGAPAYTRFLLDWQGISPLGERGGTDAGATEVLEDEESVDAVLQTIDRLAGLALPASVWERWILPARVPGYRPDMLDRLIASGEVAWCGAGRLGADDGLLALSPDDVAGDLLPDPSDLVGGTDHGDLDNTSLDGSRAELRKLILDALDDGGAYFADRLRERVGKTRGDATSNTRVPSREALADALWDLAWAGRIATDTLAPVRAFLARSGPGARAQRPRSLSRSRRRSPGVRQRARAVASLTGSTDAALAGRWSLIVRDPLDAPSANARRLARAEVMLDRSGVVVRATAIAEGVPGGFSAVVPVLGALEDAGRVLRGHFVEGLGGTQFARRDVIDRLRAHEDAQESSVASAVPGRIVVLSAVDPASPFGSSLAWPEVPGGSTPTRRAGALVGIGRGRALLWVGAGGHSVLSFSDDPEDCREVAEALVAALRRTRSLPLSVLTVNGSPVNATPLGAALKTAGFAEVPRGLRLYP